MVLFGGFNEILYDSDKQGGNDRAQWQMTNFREAVDVCGFREIPFKGYAFTYNNGREGEDNVQCRLDRALATNDWVDIFSNSTLLHLDREWSDHAPIKLLLRNQMSYLDKKERPFRFEQMWTTHEGCEEVISNAWTLGSTLKHKLDMCTEELKMWGSQNFGAIVKELRAKRKQLKKLNKGRLSSCQMQARRNLVRDIEGLVRHEEIFWRQRSRVFMARSGGTATPPSSTVERPEEGKETQ
ncbi:GTP-binding protein 10-like protein [Bienertia sinuspersici]